MGDEGSGWYLGLRAIQESARAFDLRGPETALLPMVLDHYGIQTIRQIIRIIYNQDFLREQVSVLAPKVVAIAESGDAVATEIVTTGAERLAGLALGAMRQLQQPGDEVVVYPTGGIFKAGPMIMDSFTNTIQAAWPTASVHNPRFPPVVGAYLRAIDHAGIEVDDGIRARLSESLAAL